MLDRADHMYVEHFDSDKCMFLLDCSTHCKFHLNLHCEMTDFGRICSFAFVSEHMSVYSEGQ